MMTKEEFMTGFLAFAKSKPAKEEFNAGKICSCAMAQFVKSLGAYDTSNRIYYMNNERCMYPRKAYRAAVERGITTWGNLVKELEEVMATNSVSSAIA